MTAHDQQLGGRRLLDQPAGGVVLADHATNRDIGIAFTPAGKALGEVFFGLCGNAIPRYKPLSTRHSCETRRSWHSHPGPQRNVITTARHPRVDYGPHLRAI